MKNAKYEKLRRSAKLYHRNSRHLNFIDGIVIRHLYEDKNQKDPSWSDSAVFILNDYLVNVAWRHPRYDYKSAVEDRARENCAHLRGQRPGGMKGFVTTMFNDDTPNYVKVGKSRKKISSYTMTPRSNDDYYNALQEEKSRLFRDPDNGVIIVPSMSVEWTDWSRFVSICAPIEVRNVAELHELAALTKRILKRETSLESEFKGYAYSQKDWVAEIDDDLSPGDLSHAVNI
jgi:hypothetical protein